MKQTFFKNLTIGLALFLGVVFIGNSVMAATAGIPITVPSATTTGYMLVSDTNGRYIATTTNPAHFGSIYATSTTDTSIFKGNIQIDGTCTGCGGVSGGFAGMLAGFTGATTIAPTSTPTASHYLATSTSETSVFSGNFTLTGTPTFSQLGTDMLTATNGSNVLVSTSTPTAAIYLATSTTATSTLPNLKVTNLQVTGFFQDGTLNGIIEEVDGVVGTVTVSSPLNYAGTTLSLGTVGYAFGGTGSTTAPISELIYGGATAYQSTATTSLTATSPLSLSQPISVIGSAASALSISVAGDWTGTLDTLEAASFLRSDASDSYTSGTLTFDSGTSLDLNTTTLTIADTGIAFDGASTDFAFTGNWTVNTDDLVVVKSSGNVGIGTTGPTGLLHLSTGSNSINTFSIDVAATGNYPVIALTKSRGTIAVPTAVVTGDVLHVFSVQGYDVNSFVEAAQIKVGTEGTIADGQVPGYMAFYTHPDSTSAIAERMRINAAGNVGIGTTSPVNILSVEQGTETGSFSVWNTGSSTPSFLINGVNGNGRVGIGSSTPVSQLSIKGGVTVEPNFVNSSTMALDWNESTNFATSTNANKTVTFSNVRVGQTIRIAFTNASSTALTFTWPAAVTWGDTGAPTSDAVSGGTDIFTFWAATSTESIHGRFAD